MRRVASVAMDCGWVALGLAVASFVGHGLVHSDSKTCQQACPLYVAVAQVAVAARTDRHRHDAAHRRHGAQRPHAAQTVPARSRPRAQPQRPRVRRHRHHQFHAPLCLRFRRRLRQRVIHTGTCARRSKPGTYIIDSAQCASACATCSAPRATCFSCLISSAVRSKSAWSTRRARSRCSTSDRISCKSCARRPTVTHCA